MKIAIIINTARLIDELKEKLAARKFAEADQIDYDIYTPAANEMDSVLQEIKDKSSGIFMSRLFIVRNFSERGFVTTSKIVYNLSI